MLIVLTGCAQTTPITTETSQELCRSWGNSLPTRSRSDTQQTQDEIGKAIDVFLAACPEYEHLLIAPDG